MTEESFNDSNSFWEGSMSETSSTTLTRSSFDNLSGLDMGHQILASENTLIINNQPALYHSEQLRSASYPTNSYTNFNFFNFGDQAGTNEWNTFSDIDQATYNYPTALFGSKTSSGSFDLNEIPSEGNLPLNSEFEEFPQWNQATQDPESPSIHSQYPEVLGGTHVDYLPNQPQETIYSSKGSTKVRLEAPASFPTELIGRLNQSQTSSYCLEKPFKCGECGASFSRNHDLKRHSRIHLDVKPFPCGWCDKAFSRKDALKRHLVVKGCSKNRESSDKTVSHGSKKVKVLPTQTVLPPSLPQLDCSWLPSTFVRENNDKKGSNTLAHRACGTGKSSGNLAFTQIKLQNITCSIPEINPDKLNSKRSTDDQKVAKPIRVTKTYHEKANSIKSSIPYLRF
ncbi:hypothetical protein BY996DRAFT_4069502 [Phakopsora pachyrhizi]|uniref:Expressed protein n=1 Tax=Phakopsora pachyrhizi TaxID=170000 RepID=A0AAV0AEB7_PHAPC|nr:hypothetical protein BY996DRAFT_4069502 [Phakopsora pachyrhizi]CAH7666405.1 expressed protein [Phakopsora pachyrhizi]